MSFFNFLKPKKTSPDLDDSTLNEILDKAFPAGDQEDYLGQAAVLGQQSRAATKAGEYDRAWGLLHEQKSLYMKHASRCNWKAEDVLNLDGSVSQPLANILRLEGNHGQALVHILYWIITARNPIKGHDQKLKAYFDRCKFEGVSLDEAKQFIAQSKGQPDFAAIQSEIGKWRTL